ncbi:MAG: hypothetical protein AAF544_00105 [Bacteroidota bacterium]
MLPFPVKASGITHLTDARYFAAWYVDCVGFPLDGPGAVTGHELAAMRGWIEGPKVLAELQELDVELSNLMDGLFQYGLIGGPNPINGLQFLLTDPTSGTLGGNRPAEVQKILSTHELEAWLEIPVAHYQGSEELEEILKTWAPHADGLVLNLSSGGIGLDDLLNGYGASVEQVSRWGQQCAMYLDLPITEGELALWQSKVEHAGLALRGSEEEQVGVKSFEELDEIFEALVD